MASSYAVYIDESGDEGLRCDAGSSKWFVLSGVVTRRPDVDTVKLVDKVRTRLGRHPKKPLHFVDLKHEQRVPFIEEIAQAPLRAVSVLIHKPSILEAETFREPHRLYFYAVRHLLERVSWVCRDSRRPGEGDGDGSAEIIFSNRSGMSYEDLKKYLVLLKSLSPPTTIDWSVVRCEQMQTYSAGKRMGLQIADAVASGFFKAVEPSAYGHTEDRYARMLRPIVYNKRKCFKGYGLKFWPREVEPMLETDGAFRWMRDVYLPQAGPLRAVS